MSTPFRAALAAASLFALGACASTATLPVSDASAEVMAKSDTMDTKAAEMARVETTAPAAEATTVAAPEAAAPESNETLLYGAQTKWELMSFVEAVNGAGLQSALEGETPITVFAPNNQAFEFAALGGDADVAALLAGHSVAGALDVAALQKLAAENGAGTRAELTSQAGTPLTLYVTGDVIKIAGPNGVLARVTQGDMVQSNGVMHQISSVLAAE